MESKEARLDRIRNDIAQKLEKFDRTSVAVTAPTSLHSNRVEGEIWFDHDGKKWTKKNGLVQSISKLQDAKTPYWCPECSNAMGHRFDTKFYNLYKKCYKCTIKWHTQMKIAGTFDEFERKTMRANEKAYLKDKIQEYKDYIRTFRAPQVHFENGGWEEIASIEQFSKLFDHIKNDIKLCEERIAQIELEDVDRENKNSGDTV